ncbi:CHAT domain-containing protein [Lactarius indigo]|nr:CHAT domain-containing protein [Lactarius indigo]
MASYAEPEYLEDAIQRVHRLLLVPSLSVQDRASITQVLDNFKRQRFNYFGITGNSTEIPLDFSIIVPGVSSYRGLHSVDLGPGGDSQSPIAQRGNSDLWGLAASIGNNEIADVEAAVERGRTLLPSPHTSRFSYMSALAFASVLFNASKCTKRLDYLDEAITMYRNHLRNVSGVKKAHFMALFGLLSSLILHFQLSGRKEDIEETMQLYPTLVNDGHAEVFYRFLISSVISCSWASCARLNAHPSILTAYETAMSLLQDTLVFSPTLQTQHFRLVETLEQSNALAPRLPSDYASYLIEKSQYTQAIEILERGRALLWSEMRYLRTSTDQLHAVSPALADNFTTINQQLESVMTSVAQSENTEIGEDGDREVVDAFSGLFLRQRRLSEERDSLITQIRSFPGLENFLKPLSFGVLNSAGVRGPVIIINQSGWRSDIVILRKDLPPSVISTPSNFHDRAERLKDELLRVRMERGLDSEDYDLTLASVLADLYELVGKPVVERLHQLGVPKKSRVWLCPTSAFCSLPLHAMGPIPSDDSDQVYFMDLYIPSYTPTLSALIESRKPGPQSEASDRPSLLLVTQPETLPGAWGEVDVLEAAGSPLTTLASEMATPTAVVASLRDHRFVHFVCHGLLETGKPFDASFELHGGNLTLLEIVRSRLPTAEFAFLSACHTAELTEGSLANEGLHLAAAMQYCGFRSVVGTMWSMADMDGRDISKHFYKYIFSENPGRRGLPYYERSARALQFAVKKLRKKRGVTLERWVNFVHYGA